MDDFQGWGIFFFNELDYINKYMIDKQMCSGEGTQTSRSQIQVVRKDEAGKADSMGRYVRATGKAARRSGAGMTTGREREH